MKTHHGISRYLALPILALIATACGGGGGGGNGPNGEEFGIHDERFVAMHTNEDGRIGEGAFISILRIGEDECTVDKVDDVYVPDGQTHSRVFGRKDLVALGLHTDFNPRNTENDQQLRHVKTRGAWFDLGGVEVQDLPLSPEQEERRYTAVHGTSIRVSPSGHVFYVSNNQSDYYFTDDSYSYVARFNPATGAIEHTDPTARDAFLAAQPETSDPYDNLWAVISDPIYPSNCGRYVYGTMTPRSYYSGMWYGAGANQMFRYDFVTGEFRRLGNPEENKDHTMWGMTMNGRHLLYRHDGVNKRLNLETNEITELENSPSFGPTPLYSWNDSGVVYGVWNQPGHLSLHFYSVMTDEDFRLVGQPSISGIGNSPYIGEPQVSSDGKSLLFALKAGARYPVPESEDRVDVEEPALFVMNDFASEGSEIISLCRLPTGVQGIRLIQR